MRIGVLEFHQSPEDSPSHFVTGAKAKRLVEEFRIAAWCPTLDVIKLTVEHSWSVIKAWLNGKREQMERDAMLAASAEIERIDYVTRLKNKSMYPNGAEYGFAQWPAKDLRTVVG